MTAPAAGRCSVTAGGAIDLDTRRKVWRAGHCVCGMCGHKWIGVVRLPRWYGLECPACATSAGVCLEAGWR